MLLRGNRILLIESNEAESQIQFDDDWWLLQDKSGRYFRPCDIYIVQCDVSDSKPSQSLPEDRDEAESYWGKHTRFVMYEPRMPSGSWKFVASIGRIGYRRGRKGMYLHPGPDEMPLKKPVRLYESSGRVKGYKLHLPSDCVVDDRGFVYP